MGKVINTCQLFQILSKGKSIKYLSFINKVNTNQDMLNTYNNFAQSNKQGFSATNLN